MEILDLYDENHNLTGKTITRGEKVENNYIMLSTIIIENNNKFLIQKSSSEKGSKYGLTGGHVLHKEIPLEAIIRETKEEIGIHLIKDKIKFLGYEKHPNGKAFFAIYYTNQTISPKDIKLKEDEVASISWLKKDEVEELINKEQFKKSHAHILSQSKKNISFQLQ